MNVDDAKLVSVSGWKFAEAKLPCFFAVHEADIDRTILEDDFVCEALCCFDLTSGQRRSVEIDGAVVVGHVEGNGVQVVKADEGGGEDMLSGVLLHVIATAGGVNLAADARSGREIFDRSFEVVDDSAIFSVDDFGDAESFGAGFDRAGVENLPAAGGVEGGAVEDEGGAGISTDLCDFGFEVVEERIVVVEAVGHRIFQFYHGFGRYCSWGRKADSSGLRSSE